MNDWVAEEHQCQACDAKQRRFTQVQHVLRGDARALESYRVTVHHHPGGDR